MPTICRLIQLTPDEAARLVANPATLPQRLASASIYSDVYRYWHAIEFLLARHRPGTAAANWLAMGAMISDARGDVPGARVLSSVQVQDLNADLSSIQPDDLIAHYDATALDTAQIYPSTWQAWEEEFDPLGQVLEHYSFLQQFTSQCVQAGAAILLYFDVLAEGSV
jgi:hypothetical protein